MFRVKISGSIYLKILWEPRLQYDQYIMIPYKHASEQINDTRTVIQNQEYIVSNHYTELPAALKVF